MAIIAGSNAERLAESPVHGVTEGSNKNRSVTITHKATPSHYVVASQDFKDDNVWYVSLENSGRYQLQQVVVFDNELLRKFKDFIMLAEEKYLADFREFQDRNKRVMSA